MYRYFQESTRTGHTGIRQTLVALVIAIVIGVADSSLAQRPGGITPETTISAAALPSQAVLRTRTWQPGAVYMQIGSSCVGYSLAAWLDAAPDSVYNHPNGWQIYLAAREVDGIAEPHDGTVMQAGIDVLRQIGYIGAWQSTQDMSKVLDFLRTRGPIILDSDFPQESPVLDRQGNLVWTGKMARHAWLCYGVDGQDRLSCQNSGSTSWNSSEGGRFHMTRAALASALTHGPAWLISKPQAPSARP
jgi:hypothetical protein